MLRLLGQTPNLVGVHDGVNQEKCIFASIIAELCLSDFNFLQDSGRYWVYGAHSHQCKEKKQTHKINIVEKVV